MEYGFKEYKKADIKRNHLNLGQVRADGSSYQVNSLYIEKDGKPWIGIMGEFHFVRYPRSDWEMELAKMKAGGITTVAFYVFWIYHEEIEGQYDFTGDRDLRYFVELCQKLGLTVMLRIGPWAHGEVRNGGFPDWLLKKGFKLRTNDSGYLECVRDWYTKIYEQVQGLFFKDGGPIIGIQIENELVNQCEHLGKLKEIAVSIGFDVPIWTVTGWDRLYGAKFPVKEFLPVFGAYVDAPWLNHTKPLPPSHHFTFNTMRNDAAIGVDLINETDDEGWRLPYEDYPFATCELGSGLPTSYIRRPYVAPMDAYALSLVKLGCGNNLVGYYMYHGGTNKLGKLSTLHESKATGYPNDYAILNYDFMTCIGQYGQVRNQYRLCNLLHMFINDFGDILAPMEHVASKDFVEADDADSLRYAMRTDGHSGFVFFNHHQRNLKLNDVKNVVIDTGSVKFPQFDVQGDVAFILPFNLSFAKHNIEYATAQLLCKYDNTLFFAAVPGVKPEYSVDGKIFEVKDSTHIATTQIGDVTIVTIPWEVALYLRKVDGKVFAERKINKGICHTELTIEDSFHIPELDYPEEFSVCGGKELQCKKLSVDSPDGLVSINMEFDVAQIIADGKLVADCYYYGKPWEVSASLIYGKETYMVYTPVNKEIYMDYDENLQ
ncbi:Glycosyl hydrolases family 35 [Pseudobutyrivibrio ruminis]|uniref:Glycosyl hydrolases family 35 n=1 Tax=Pseudobutyrivibrio ruminis TaxID=46206 RepID=A0A1H7HTD1_9FIRM|nr:beta-galactosidase [Pseudobutyrivibrio ruminis]SEK53444.1 Glycosyl hydrolases family 35 [Pseudobutyrivibrio ruminis]